MLYKFQNVWNKNSKWLCWKGSDTKCVNEKELKTLTLQKLYCNTEHWRLGKVLWMAES